MPKKQQSPQSAQSPTTAPTTMAPANQAGVGNQAAAGGKQGGVMGWFRRAGAWMGDKVDAATETVGQWVDNTQQVAKDAWELATSTSVGMEDGKVFLETDLDELSDLLSPETHAALALDRATADNRVRISYERASGQLVATSDDIALSGIQTAQLQTGAVHLKGVRAVFTNAGGGVPGLDENFSLLGFKDKADNLKAVVTVADASALDVRFRGPDGPTSVASVRLAGLTGTVGGQGGMPFGDAGTTNVDIALEHAVLEGLASEGHTVARVDAKGVSAGMSGGDESAFLAVDHLGVAGASVGGNTASAASVDGVRVDVDNKGGGLLGVDGKADRAKARVAVEAAHVQGLDTADVDAAAVQMSQLRGEWDTTNSTGSASVASLSTDGLDSSWVDANRLQANNLSLSGDIAGVDGRRDAHLRMSSLTGDGLSVTPSTKASAAPGVAGLPLDYSAEVDTIDLKNTNAGGAHIASAHLGTAGIEGYIDGADSSMWANIMDTELKGFSHQAFNAGELSTRNTTLTASATQTTATADSISGSAIRAANFSADALHGYGGSAEFKAGSASASLNNARMSGATIADRTTVQSAEVDGFTASRVGDVGQVGVGRGTLTGVSDRPSGAQLASGELVGLNVQHNGATNDLEAKLARADLRGGKGLGAELGGASVVGVAAQVGAGGAQLSADQASVDALKMGNNSVDHALAKGLDIKHGNDSDAAQVASLTASGVRAGSASVADVSANGIRGERKGADLQGSVDNVRAADIRAGDASVASVSANGIRGERKGADLQGGIDSLSANTIALGQDVKIANTTATGLAGAHNANGTQASVQQASANGVAYQSGGTRASVDHASVGAGAVSIDNAGHTTAGAGSIHASGIKASGASSSGGTGGAGGIDTARLVKTGAAQVRDAEISAQARLHGGDLGVAGLSAKPNTQVDAGISVRGGQIQQQGTGVSLSSPIKGPLWTSVNGAYVKDNQLKADVRGWADKDLTGMMNEAVGIDGKKLPSVAALGAGVANKLDAPSSSSGGGFDVGSIVDMKSVRGEATVGLGDGVVDAGAGRVDLGRAQQAGDNQIHASMAGGSVQADIDRFLADSASWRANGSQVSTGPASAAGVAVQAGDNGWSANVNELDLKDVRAGR